MLLVNALAVVPVFQLATQLGGRLAGAAAVWILMVDIGTLGIRLTTLHNMSFLAFLGQLGQQIDEYGHRGAFLGLEQSLGNPQPHLGVGLEQQSFGGAPTLGNAGSQHDLGGDGPA